MFFLKCCQQFNSGYGYQIIQTNQKDKTQVVTFHQAFHDIQSKDLENPCNRVVKVKKSDFQEVYGWLVSSDKKFQDTMFPPDNNSLGDLNVINLKSSQWRRISEIIKTPELFGEKNKKKQPKDIIQNNLGNCYFLSALAALLEKEQNIIKLFFGQQYNKTSIYKVQIRLYGSIEEYVVDDYIPVNQNGKPIFCQPNKNQFWVLILQKAWAKAKGSYRNIIPGTPTDVFKALTFAPSEIIKIKQGEDEQKRVWKKVFDYSNRKYPMCCGTDQKVSINWKNIKLLPSHTYTLVTAAELEDVEGRTHKIIKIRNPWGQNEWQGQGSSGDIFFWNRIASSSEKKQFLAHPEAGNEGIFYMTLTDFCIYFKLLHVCMLEPYGNYISQQMKCNNKNGSIYETTITKKGDYFFSIHLSRTHSQKEQALSRSTILVIKINLQNKQKYVFVDGQLKYNQDDATLQVQLQPGNYLIYVKIDSVEKQKQLTHSCNVSVYSKQFIILLKSSQNKHPDLLKKVFLEHAKQNKRTKYNNDLMWISWRLLFKQGGYAYIAMGNDSASNKKFIINFDEDEFNSMSFSLKKPYKGKGNGQMIEVLPGQEKIILARVKNQMIKSLKFPPPLGIKMELID